MNKFMIYDKTTGTLLELNDNVYLVEVPNQSLPAFGNIQEDPEELKSYILQNGSKLNDVFMSLTPIKPSVDLEDLLS